MSLYDSFENLALKSVNYLKTKRRARHWTRKISGRLAKERTLTHTQKNDIKEYYKDYAKVNMIFHEFYTQKTGKFHKNYMVDDIYYCMVDPYFNNWETAKHLDNKCFYDKWYFNGENIPKTLAKCANGMWMLPQDGEFCFVSKEQAYSYISQQDCCVKKAAMSVGGKGIYKITKGTPVDEVAKRLDLLGSEIIVQEIVKQSDVMNKLNPHSVNTVRVLSFLNKDGSVTVYSSIVRMGVDDSFVDNASSGGITCGIDADGRLKSVAYANSGTRYDNHPTTGLKFDEIVIPNFDKVLSTVKRLHKDFPHFRLLSWDFAIDKNDEPLIIEINLCYGGLNFHQLNNGPLFGDDTNKILDEVFGKNKI